MKYKCCNFLILLVSRDLLKCLKIYCFVPLKKFDYEYFSLAVFVISRNYKRSTFNMLITGQIEVEEVTSFFDKHNANSNTFLKSLVDTIIMI